MAKTKIFILLLAESPAEFRNPISTSC
jgi:hypothetical protein